MRYSVRCMKFLLTLVAFTFLGIRMDSYSRAVSGRRQISYIRDTQYPLYADVPPSDFVINKPVSLKYTYPYNIDFVHLLEGIKTHREIPLEPINPHNFNYITNPIHLCKIRHKRNGIFILVLVKSARKNFHLRQSIRFAKADKKFKKWRKHVRIAFLLGYSFNESNREISKESAIFGDIVQEDFEDSYKNLTYKTIMGYNWAVSHCPRATHILYQDDDFLFNLDNLFKYLSHHKNLDSVYIGYSIEDAIPQRKKNSKHYISEEEYPHSTFPPYFPGGAYLVSMNIAQRLVRAFPYVKHLSVDDVYLGIVAFKLNITLQDSSLVNMNNCSTYSHVIACRGYSTKHDIFEGWRNFARKTYDIESN